MQLNNRNFTIILFIAAFAIRLAFVGYFGNFENPEMYEHGKIARNLLIDNGFAMHWPYPSNSAERLAEHAAPPEFEGAFIPPSNPYLLYVVMEIFGDNAKGYFILMLLNAIFSAVTVVLTYQMAKQFFNERASRISGILGALFLPNAFGCVTFSGSPLYQMLALAILLCLVLYIKKPDIKTLIIAALLISLQIFTRSEFLMLGNVLLFISAAVVLYLRKHRFPTVLLHYGMAVALIFLTISPWMYRNTELFGKFVPIVSHPWHEIWRGNNEMATGGAFGKNNESIWLSENHSPHLIDKLDSLEYNAYFEIAADSVFKEEAQKFIKNNPTEYMMLSLKRVLFLWSVDIYTPRAKSIPYVFFILITIPAGFYGLYKSGREHRFITVPIVIFFMFYTMLFGLVNLETRYQIYMLSTLIPFTGLMYDKLLGKFLNK